MRKKTCIICSKEHSNSMSKVCSPWCQRKHNANLNNAKKEKVKLKKEKAKVKRLLSPTALKKEADRVWSIYIRERDRWLPCITCWVEWNETHQAWHFMSRRHLNTRWEMYNGAWQCIKCNNWWCGEQYEFALALEKKSPWLPEQLRRLALCTDKVTEEEILCYIRILYAELNKLWFDFKPKSIYLR
jgi:hypothetical protein